MPVDTSIYGMLQQPKPAPGPLEMAAQGLQVQNMVGANRLQGLQTQQAEQTLAMQPELQRAAAEKAALERKKLEAETGRAQAEALYKNSTLLRDQLAGVRDQASYDAWRELGARLMGPDMARGVPAVFDPATQAQMLRKADDFNKKIELRMTDLGGTIQPTDPYTGRPVGEAIAKTPAPQAPQGATWDPDRGVFVQPPARGAMAPGSVAAPTGGVPLPPKTADVAAVRREFNDLPEVKNYRSVVPIFNSAIEAPDNKAGDIQFAYTIGKIFDPNSVVREGELKLVGDAANVFQKYMGEMQALTQGKGRLTEQTRQELLAAAKARVDELKSGHDMARQTYETTAKARGLPLNEIFVEAPALKAPKQKPQTPEAQQTIGGKNYVKIGGKWFEAGN